MNLLVRSIFLPSRNKRKTGPDLSGHIENAKRVVLIDYGVKRNIMRNLVSSGLAVTVVPATTSAEDILALNPDGVVLSNGPGDPAATGEYAIPTIKALVEADVPMLGICLGHQMLALALGAKTVKMEQGHHGANHPVKDHTTDKGIAVSALKVSLFFPCSITQKRALGHKIVSICSTVSQMP